MPKTNKALKISLIICICFCSWSFIEREQKHFTINGQAQGTTYSISYYNQKEKVTKREVDSILLVIDDSMSLYKSTSLISKINRSQKGGTLDPHFLKVIQKAIQINKETDGIFDVTVAPLVEAWGFAAKKIKQYPDSLAIAKILPLIGMNNIKLEGNYLKKLKPDVKIDLNGIAQGYTVDVLADYFLSKGIKNFLIELGGELRVEGIKNTGENFTVGIEGPINAFGNQVAIKHIAIIKGKALTTSGSYRNYKQNGSARLTHIINPKTGYPIQSKILSVTLLAKDAITADGYDNTLLAMELKDALHFVEHRPDLEAYFVYENKKGSIVDTMTNGFKKILKK